MEKRLYRKHVVIMEKGMYSLGYERGCNHQYYKRDTGQGQRLFIVEKLNVCKGRLAVEMVIVEMYCGVLDV